MKYARIVVWVLLVPAGLLFFAWKMNWHISDVRSGALEEREREQRMSAMQAQNEQQSALYMAGLIEGRRALAQTCVARALLTLGGVIAKAPSTLVILNYKGCGPQCDTDAVAIRMADKYVLEGLQVLLIRTVEENQQPTPLGVHTVTITDCKSLASDYGDDYFFRNAKGELSSSGARHEGYMRERKAMTGVFDPEPLVRQGLGISQ